MEKYFKIGEISKLYGIGVDSLRYYEEIGLIQPKRSESGYRLYSTHDIWRLNVIRELRELGFSMERIKENLSAHTLKNTKELLGKEKEAIEKKLKELYELQKNVEHRLCNIELSSRLPIDTITTEHREIRKCFSTPEGYKEEHEMDILIKRLLNLNKDKFYVIGNNQIGTIISLREFEKSHSLKYKSAFIIDESGTQTLKSGKYLSVCYKGVYDKSAVWAEKLLAYCKQNKLTPCGDFLEILWIDIHSSADENEHITQLEIPVNDE